MAVDTPEADEGESIEKPSYNVIMAVSAYGNTRPEDLPPLYDTIDPSTLDMVIESMSAGEISFRYDGFDVLVRDDGSVTVDPETM